MPIGPALSNPTRVPIVLSELMPLQPESAAAGYAQSSIKVSNIKAPQPNIAKAPVRSDVNPLDAFVRIRSGRHQTETAAFAASLKQKLNKFPNPWQTLACDHTG